MEAVPNNKDVNEEGIKSEDEFHDCETETDLNTATISTKDCGDNAASNIEDLLKNVHITPEGDNEDDDDDDKEFKDADTILLDDFVDEDFMKEEESSLTEEKLKERFEKAKESKDQGKEEYKAEQYENSIKSYTRALLICPLCEKEYRAILYGNRAAAKIKFGAKDGAVMDCTKSLEYKPNYMKSLVRRSQLYEEMDKLDEALEDYKKIFEMDPSNKDAYYATQRLPPLINERNEKLKTEMMGKLKDLGNMVLRPFGLSTNNFQLQPTDAGGYTINFKQ